MFTKGQASVIKSLHDKKHRQKTGLFLVEGEKNVSEVINSDFEIKTLLATKVFYSKYSKIIKSKKINYELVEACELEKVGSLESNDSALAIVNQKPFINKLTIEENEIILALDNIRDPGNFGTIIRIADWYGIKKIIASTGTVDFYNPKVISATKGSFIRVTVRYADLADFLSKAKTPILGAFLEGENIHQAKFPKSGILVMGNESQGICPEIEKIITKKITIPSFSSQVCSNEQNGSRAESLNVAIATAIIIDNWKNKEKTL